MRSGDGPACFLYCGVEHIRTRLQIKRAIEEGISKLLCSVRKLKEIDFIEMKEKISAMTTGP